MSERAHPVPVPRTPRTEVRRRLLDAAAEVFAERGYADSGVAEIAARAGFTKGAVYSNFTSKQELFGALLFDHSADVVASAMTRLIDEGVSVRELPDRAAAMLADLVAGDWHVLLTELAAQAGRDSEAARAFAGFRRRQRAMLTAALTQGAPRLGLDARIDLDRAAFTLLAVINGLALERRGDPEVVTQQWVTGALADVLRGLVSAELLAQEAVSAERSGSGWAPRGSNPEPAD